MRTSIVVSLVLCLTAGATVALDQYDSHNPTDNNHMNDFSYDFETVYRHQERKLSNLFSTDDDKQEYIASASASTSNIFFDDEDTGNDKEQVSSCMVLILEAIAKICVRT